MRNKNTLGKAQYILLNIVFVFLTMFVFDAFLYIDLKGFTVSESKTFFEIMLLLIVSLGILITFKKRRNYISIAVNVLLPYEIYTVISFWPYFSNIFSTILSITIVLAIAYSCLVIYLKVNDKSTSGALYFRGVGFAFLGGRTIVAVCLLSIITFSGIMLETAKQIQQTPTITSETVSDVPGAEEWTVKNKIDTVKLLQEEEWQELSTQEKIDVLGVITNIEMRYLGINQSVSLGADTLEGNTFAQYNQGRRQIAININHLDESLAYDVLHSLLHEVYHVYQHAQVEALEYIPDEYKGLQMFSYPQKYAEEFSDYIDGDENYLLYMMQLVETTAEAYADKAVDEYYELIEQYTS